MHICVCMIYLSYRLPGDIYCTYHSPISLHNATLKCHRTSPSMTSPIYLQKPFQIEPISPKSDSFINIKAH